MKFTDLIIDLQYSGIVEISLRCMFPPFLASSFQCHLKDKNCIARFSCPVHFLISSSAITSILSNRLFYPRRGSFMSSDEFMNSAIQHIHPNLYNRQRSFLSIFSIKNFPILGPEGEYKGKMLEQGLSKLNPWF